MVQPTAYAVKRLEVMAMPSQTDLSPDEIVIGNKHFQVKYRFNRYFGYMPAGERSAACVVGWYNDRGPMEVLWYTPDGAAPVGVPAADEADLAFKIATLEYPAWDIRLDGASPSDHEGCLESLSDLAARPGAQIYRVNDNRIGYGWSYLIATSQPATGLCLPTGVLFHFGPEDDQHVQQCLTSYEDVVALIGSPGACTIGYDASQPNRLAEPDPAATIVALDFTSWQRGVDAERELANDN